MGKMIMITRITVSVANSVPRRILVRPSDIKRCEEKDHPHDKRVKALLIIGREYSEQIVYVSDNFLGLTDASTRSWRLMTTPNAHTPSKNPFKDYFGMEIPAWVKGLGFEDRSWHNDAGAFMAREFQPKKLGFQGLTLRIFFADPEDHGNWLGCQYGLFVTGMDEETHEKDATIYWGNDEQEMIAATRLMVSTLQELYG